MHSGSHSQIQDHTVGQTHRTNPITIFLGMLIDASFCLYPANTLGIPAKLVVFGWAVSQLVGLFWSQETCEFQPNKYKILQL